MWKIVALACLSLTMLSACSDDDCVQCPGSLEPTMANLWPHADGTAWTYDLDYRVHAGFPPPDEPEPMPSMEDLHEALGLPVETALMDEERGTYRLRFDGEVTTESGVTAQNLVGTFSSELAGTVAQAAGDGLLRLIARARPDLREAILARHPGLASGSKSLAEVSPPYFLGQYAFAFEDSGYYGYGDIGREHSWVYLEGDLAVGSEFSLQLVPDLAQDIWLRGRIWSIGRRSFGGGVWRHALECFYTVDLGVQDVTDESGSPIGSFHAYMYGATVFAPGGGPVACRERSVFGPDPFGGSDGQIVEYDCVIRRSRPGDRAPEGLRP